MAWKRYVVCLVLSIPLALGLYLAAEQAVAARAESPRAKAAPAAAAPVKVETCYQCHDEIRKFHAKGRHAKVNCVACHEGLTEHAQDPSEKPRTRMDHAACGGCHQDQYESMVAVNLQSKARQEKATFRSRSPLFDKLIMPHGFSKEHAEPRSRAWSGTP